MVHLPPTLEPGQPGQSQDYASSTTHHSTSSSPSSFATLSFDTADKLRLIQFPFPLISALSSHLKTLWPAGIQQERIYAIHAYEFKLKGWPFALSALSSGKDIVAGIRLVRDVLAFLYARGWKVETGMGIERAVGSMDTFVLRQRRKGGKEKKRATGTGEKEEVVEGRRIMGAGVGMGMGSDGGDVVIPPEAEWLVISPEKGDRLRVIYDVLPSSVTNSTEIERRETEEEETTDMPGERHYDEYGDMIQALKGALTEVDYFQSGNFSEKSYEFKLKGWPWSEMGERAVKVRRLVLKIMETLEGFGWRSYTTLQRRGAEKSRGLDTWFFVREKGWDE
jgi:hypothetical protein